ncbi:MAG: hypothetical protein ABL907_14940 [Hyphomicrobium sp.]
MTSSAQALGCQNDDYTGYGSAKKWKQGRSNARTDWSRKVDDHLGWPWSEWRRASVKDERCRWNGSKNKCRSEAYPCR